MKRPRQKQDGWKGMGGKSEENRPMDEKEPSVFQSIKKGYPAGAREVGKYLKKKVRGL